MDLSPKRLLCDNCNELALYCGPNGLRLCGWHLEDAAKKGKAYRFRTIYEASDGRVLEVTSVSLHYPEAMRVVEEYRAVGRDAWVLDSTACSEGIAEVLL